MDSLEANTANKWLIGEIKFFNEDRGFGFVDCWDDKQEYFIHVTKVKTQPVKESDYVYFKLRPSRKKPGTFEAKDLSLLFPVTTGYSFIADKYHQYSNRSFRRAIVQNIPSGEVLKLFKSGLDNFAELNDDAQYLKFRESYREFIISVKDSTIHPELEQLTNSHLLKAASNFIVVKSWIDGIYTDLPKKELVEDFFKAHVNLRSQLLKKVEDPILKKELLNLLLAEEKPEEVLIFLKAYLVSVDDTGYSVDLNKPDFWSEKKDYYLHEYALSVIEPKMDLLGKIDLYRKGFLKKVESAEIISSSHAFSLEELQFVLQELINQQEDKISLLSRYLSEIPVRIEELKTTYFPDPPDYFQNDEERNNWHDLNPPPSDPEFWDWYEEQPLKFYLDFLQFANKQLEEEGRLKIEQAVLLQQPEFHFDLWEKGLIQEIPYTAISGYFHSESDFHKKIQEWLQTNRIAKEEIVDILVSNILNIGEINDRDSFLVLHHHLQELFELKKDLTPLEKQISVENISFFRLSNWISGRSEYFTYDEYKNKLVYLSNQDQIKFLKKLFWLAHEQKFNITVEKLDELTRIDLNLYNLNNKYNPEIPLDISVHVVIEALKAFSKHDKFLLENELLQIVLKDLSGQKKKRFQLQGLFEKCPGRTEMKYNWKREGEITKEHFGDGKYYLGIHFSPGERIYNNRGRYEYVPNSSFEGLKEKVKDLPGRKWNPEKEHWGVPSRYEDEVIQFAQANRFYLDFEGSNYKNNPHLASPNIIETPIGLSFCEGRLAKKPDNIFQKEFWWCHNQPCYQNCETIHKPEDWEYYTLLDFCLILGFNLDDGNRVGDFIERGKYYQFISTINRFNRLLRKMFCTSCKSILHPVEDSHFAHYRVVRFQCEDPNCEEHHKEIYLHHCLNGKCNSIIDSRVSKKCSNGLYICSNKECGCCCSHNMMNRRLQNLQTTGGYIPPNLVSSVENKLGHMERAEHFCYDCGKEMEEIANEVFRCTSCEITYDLTNSNFKRPHKHLGKINLKSDFSSGGDEDLFY